MAHHRNGSRTSITTTGQYFYKQYECFFYQNKDKKKLQEYTIHFFHCRDPFVE
jgi:hypothetical protein